MARNTPMKEPKKRSVRTRLDKDERHGRLLEVGLRVFAERPYDELSIDDLAKRAGISKGLLYHYFPTKRDFYVETVREAARRLAEETMTPETLPPLERLTHGLEAYLDFVHRHGKAYAALMRGGIGADPEVASIIEQTRQDLISRIMVGAPISDREPLVEVALRGWVGFVEATAVEWALSAKPSRKALVELWLRVLFVAVPLR
jgi:AcrR family transcriptional regulator